jgi:hypothetical protein
LLKALLVVACCSLPFQGTCWAKDVAPGPGTAVRTDEPGTQVAGSDNERDPLQTAWWWIFAVSANVRIYVSSPPVLVEGAHIDLLGDTPAGASGQLRIPDSALVRLADGTEIGVGKAVEVFGKPFRAKGNVAEPLSLVVDAGMAFPYAVPWWRPSPLTREQFSRYKFPERAGEHIERRRQMHTRIFLSENASLRGGDAPFSSIECVDANVIVYIYSPLTWIDTDAGQEGLGWYVWGKRIEGKALAAFADGTRIRVGDKVEIHRMKFPAHFQTRVEYDDGGQVVRRETREVEAEEVAGLKRMTLSGDEPREGSVIRGEIMGPEREGDEIFGIRSTSKMPLRVVLASWPGTYWSKGAWPCTHYNPLLERMRQLEIRVREYYADNERLPPALSDLDASGSFDGPLVDIWGREFHYTVASDNSVTLATYGPEGPGRGRKPVISRIFYLGSPDR